MDQTSKKIREDFVMMINQNSDNLSQYNWIDITIGFDYDTMAFIICRIKDEKVVKEVVKCIKNSWDFALLHRDPICFVTDSHDSRFKVVKYRGEHSIAYVLNQILKSRKTFKDMIDFTNNTDSSKKIVQTEKRIAVLESENKKLNDKNKELKEENERLKQEKEELKEIKMIMDTPLDGIEADSKVGLTEILKLMKNDGANFVKHNNKTIAAKALKMMTGRSESACKQIFSSPLSPTYSGHKNKISELNGYLKALGMKTLL